ncbi:MAG: archease [Elusimicrobiota bacterium]
MERATPKGPKVRSKPRRGRAADPEASRHGSPPGSKPGFEIVPHTSDVGLRISGPTWKAFYKNAALGLLCVYGLEKTRRGPLAAEIHLRADNPEDLLVDWLTELIYRVSAELWLPARIRILSADDRSLEAHVSGDGLQETKVKTEVKAATYHGLKVVRQGGLWTATLILDV